MLVTAPDLPDEAAAMVARTPSGDCVFYHRHSGLCVIHRDMGSTELPATCQHFPRLALTRSTRHVHHVDALLSDGREHVVP